MQSAPAFVTTRRIFGVEVLSCHLDQACDLIEARIAERTPTRVAFLNANLSLLAVDRSDLREALDGFVVFNDGIGIAIANRILNGSTFAANLNGTDLVPHFLSRARRSLRIFLLGAKPETLQKAARTIEGRWPRHVVVGQVNGYFKASQETLIQQAIAAARPDIVLVAMGNPNQELWISRNIPHCAPCALGVGALFDFLTGEARRAPRWMRAVRFEWLFRLACEPRRLWRRYLIGNAAFLAYVFALWVAQRTGRSPGSRADAIAADGPGLADRERWEPWKPQRIEGDSEGLVNAAPPLAASAAVQQLDAIGTSKTLSRHPV
jgi:alpha-1,3-mannosyltransferase